MCIAVRPSIFLLSISIYFSGCVQHVVRRRFEGVVWARAPARFTDRPDNPRAISTRFIPSRWIDGGPPPPLDTLSPTAPVPYVTHPLTRHVHRSLADHVRYQFSTMRRTQEFSRSPLPAWTEKSSRTLPSDRSNPFTVNALNNFFLLKKKL